MLLAQRGVDCGFRALTRSKAVIIEVYAAYYNVKLLTNRSLSQISAVYGKSSRKNSENKRKLPQNVYQKAVVHSGSTIHL